MKDTKEDKQGQGKSSPFSEPDRGDMRPGKAGDGKFGGGHWSDVPTDKQKGQDSDDHR